MDAARRRAKKLRAASAANTPATSPLKYLSKETVANTARDAAQYRSKPRSHRAKSLSAAFQPPAHIARAFDGH